VTHIFITFNLRPLCLYVEIGNGMRIKLTQHTTYYHKAFTAKKLYDSSCDKCSDVC